MKKYTLYLFILIALAFIVLAFINHGARTQTPMWARSNEERVNVLKGYGWEVSQEPIEEAEINIPDPLDEVYKEYNKLQIPLGLDIEKHKGKQAVRYTYEVMNHENAKGRQVRANLLVYNEQIIAGDIMVTAIDGFMHGLDGSNR